METHQKNRRPDLSKSSHYRINLFRLYTEFFIFSCWFMLKWFIILETSNSLAIKVIDIVMCISKEGGIYESDCAIHMYQLLLCYMGHTQSRIFRSNLFHIPLNPHSIRNLIPLKTLPILITIVSYKKYYYPFHVQEVEQKVTLTLLKKQISCSYWIYGIRCAIF